jgi:hypothetical protein
MSPFPRRSSGVTLRRRLASPGLVGVRFAPLPRLIADRALPVLASAGARPLTAVQRRAAARAVLATSSGMLGDSARRSESTTDVVAGVFAELDEAAANDATIEALAAGGRALAELAGLYHRYLDVVAAAVRPEQLADAALAGTRDTPLIVYLPRRLTPVELRFCEGMAARGRLRVVLALTGEEPADRDARSRSSTSPRSLTRPSNRPSRRPARS